MDREIKSDVGNLFSGLLLGGLIGVGIGIVFAPLVSEDFKKKIKEKIDNFEIEGIQDRLSEAFESGIKEAKKVSQEMGE